MTTTHTSGAADLRATFSEMLVDLPNTEPFTLFKAGFDAALAAGQATAVPENIRGILARCRDFIDTTKAPAYPAGADLADEIDVLLAAQAVVPAGWKLVPVDATDEMVRATDEVNFENGDTDGTIHNVWHVMIAAAPALPAAQQGVAYAALPTSSHAGRVYEEGFLIGTCPLYTADKLRAFADATHTLRASHGQAPAAVPDDFLSHKLAWREAIAQCGLAVSADDPDRSYWEHELRAFDRAYSELASITPQADSVQEDAARYRFLRDGEWRDTDLEPFIRLQLNTLWDAKIDAARAAQEGGK